MFLAWLHIEACTAHAKAIVTEATEFTTSGGTVAYQLADGSVRSAYPWERVCQTREEAVEHCLAGMRAAATRLSAQADELASQEAPPCVATT